MPDHPARPATPVPSPRELEFSVGVVAAAAHVARLHEDAARARLVRLARSAPPASGVFPRDASHGRPRAALGALRQLQAALRLRRPESLDQGEACLTC